MIESQENSHEQVEATKFEVANITSEITGAKREDIQLDNTESFLGGSRFIYIRTPNEFGKYTTSTENDANRKDKLMRENIASSVVESLSIPSAKITHPYQEVGDNGAVLFFEKLSAENGIIFASPEEIAGLEEDKYEAFAEASARIIAQLTEKPVPSSEDTSKLLREARYSGPEKSIKLLGDSKTIIQQERFRELLDSAVGPVYTEESNSNTDHEYSGREYIDSLLNECENNILDLCSEFPEQEGEYLVHGDSEPKNVYLQESKDGYSGLMIDYEYAGVTNFPVLAALNDMSNYYGRLWPNPEYQKEFSTQIYKTMCSRMDPEQSLMFARTAAMYGTFYLSKFPLRKVAEDASPTSEELEGVKESAFILSQMSNLPDVLAHLDELYLESLAETGG